MFGLGFTEILIILLIILLVVGPEKLPEFAQTLGRAVWKVRHATDELVEELHLNDLKSVGREIRHSAAKLEQDINPLDSQSKLKSSSTDE
jgi:sec-independent protein translocase protein TatB